eukprot:scaffold82792_cov33-Tisochrysis_lutea.AAC.1
MAELHLVGQLLGGGGFQLNNLFCKFTIEAGANFRLLQGLTTGQTHCDYPNVRAGPSGVQQGRGQTSPFTLRRAGVT